VSPILRRLLFWLPVLVAVAAGFAWPLREQPIPVDIGVVDRGELVVSIEEEGRTVVRERYRVLAPVSGTLARIDLDPGDPVEAGTTVVARIEPAEPSLLDLGTRLERLAALQSAEAAVAEAEARVEQARAARDCAERERERIRRLVERRAAPAAGPLSPSSTAARSCGGRRSAPATSAWRKCSPASKPASGSCSGRPTGVADGVAVKPRPAGG
jgi:HlyD family secretion protein